MSFPFNISEIKYAIKKLTTDTIATLKDNSHREGKGNKDCHTPLKFQDHTYQVRKV